MKKLINIANVVNFILLPMLFVSGCATLQPEHAADDDTLVIYQRSGGFVGLDDHLTIDANGQAVLVRHEQTTQFSLSTQDLTQLTALLEQANFPQLADDYPAPKQAADYITYTIQYAGHKVKAIDTTLPETLYPLLDRLDQLLE